MSKKIIFVFTMIVMLCGANVVTAAPPKNVAQQCAAQCHLCQGGSGYAPGGPGEPGHVEQDSAACAKETQMCINECINRANQPKNANPPK